jgi:hypothetical protein
MPKKINNKKSKKIKIKNKNVNKNKNIINIKIGNGDKKSKEEAPIIYAQSTNRQQYLDTNTLAQQEQQYKILSEINKIKQDNEIKKLTTQTPSISTNTFSTQTPSISNFSSQYPEPVSTTTFTSHKPERTYIKYFDDKLKNFLKPNEEVKKTQPDDDDDFFNTIEQGSYLHPPDINKINNLSSLHIPKSNMLNNEPSPLSPTSAALFNIDEGEMKFEHHEPITGSSNIMMNQDEIKQPIKKKFNKPKHLTIDYNDYDYSDDEIPLKSTGIHTYTTPHKDNIRYDDDYKERLSSFFKAIDYDNLDTETKPIEYLNNPMYYKKDIDNTPLINLDNRELRSGTSNIMIDQEPSTGAAHIMTDQEPEITGISVLTGKPFEPDIPIKGEGKDEGKEDKMELIERRKNLLENKNDLKKFRENLNNYKLDQTFLRKEDINLYNSLKFSATGRTSSAKSVNVKTAYTFLEKYYKNVN